jgi:chromosome segregation ATPase
MSMQKYDQKTKKKLMSQYQTTINTYKKENNKLLSEIEDLKITLNINQELLYHFISCNSVDNEKIKNLINKSKTLWKDSESLIEKKSKIEIETVNIQKEMVQIPIKINSEINNLSSQIYKKKNELKSKDNAIKRLKIELDKTRKSAFFKTARTEVFVTEPTKLSVELNGELLNTKNILLKVSNKHSKDKKESNKLGKEVKNLRDEMIKLKKTAIRIYNKINNKNQILDKSNNNNKNIDDENNFLEKIGYKTLVDDYEKEEQEEEEKEESEESSDENSTDETINNNNNKNKKKEFENLTEQLNKLKSQYKEYQNKINEYKKVYKDLKNKIEYLKNKNNNEKQE